MEPSQTQPAATDVACAPSAFTAATGGASNLEDGRVLHATPVARPGGGAAPQCGRGMAGASRTITGAAAPLGPRVSGDAAAAAASGAGASRWRSLAPAAHPGDGMPPWSRRGTATAMCGYPLRCRQKS